MILIVVTVTTDWPTRKVHIHIFVCAVVSGLIIKTFTSLFNNTNHH
jgi:hypothetical protein